MERLTLDTNVLLEYWKDQKNRAVTQQLLDLARDGQVGLMVTARIREDVPHDPLAREISRLPELGIAEGPSVTRLGYWVLGRDMLGSDEFDEASKQLSASLAAKGRKPPDWRDWDHLHSHFLQDRDVYLTWDQAVLELSAALHERFALVVMTPQDFLAKHSS